MGPSAPVTTLFEGDITGVEWVDESPARSEEGEMFDVRAGPGTSPHRLLLQAAAHLVRLLLRLATPLSQLSSHSQGCGEVIVIPKLMCRSSYLDLRSLHSSCWRS